MKIYQDDFNTERRDRERAQVEKDSQAAEVNNLKEDLIRSRDQTRQRELDVIQLRDQNRKMAEEHDAVSKEMYYHSCQNTSKLSISIRTFQ